MGWRENLKVLGVGDLRCVFGATLVSNLGDGIVAIALAWAVLDLTHSPIDLGVVLACRLVAQILVVLLGGVIADRISRRKVMMAADLMRLCGQGAVGLLLVTHSATVFEVIVSQVLLGGASAFFQPASTGLIPSVAGEYKQEANALLGIAASAPSIVGPMLGALLVVAVGARWGLLVDAASYGLSALLLSRISPGVGDAPVSSGARQSMLADLREGFGEVRSRTWVWAVIVAFAFANSLMTTWDVFGPLATRRWYGGAPAYALLSALWSVGTLLGGVAMLRFKPRRPLFFGVLICIPCTFPSILVALRLPLAIVVPFQLLSGLGPIALNTLWWTALQQHVPSGAISRVVSFDYAGSYLLMPLGTALAGPLAVAIGLRNAMLICSFASAAVTAAALLVNDVRNLQSTPAAADIVNA